MILIVIIACIFGYRYVNKQQTVLVPKNTTKVIYQVRTNESFPETYDMIEEGTVIYDSVKNYPIGIVKKKELIPSERYEINLSDGTYEKSELPSGDLVDIVLTIEADAQISEQNIAIGDYIIKVGNEAFVKGKGYAGVGYVITIER